MVTGLVLLLRKAVYVSFGDFDRIRCFTTAAAERDDKHKAKHGAFETRLSTYTRKKLNLILFLPYKTLAEIGISAIILAQSVCTFSLTVWLSTA